MPEARAPADPTLQAAALRYAAGDLTPAEAAAFEARLAQDQATRDALAEAVRLSAAALGQEPPAPHRSFRAAARERLLGWCPGWLARRAYRGHPALWVGSGAAAVAACVTAGFLIAGNDYQDGADPEDRPAAALVAPEGWPAPPGYADTPEQQDGDSLAAAQTQDGDETQAQTVAELWAEWSTPEAVEKVHDDEMRWRQRHRDPGCNPPARGAGVADARGP